MPISELLQTVQERGDAAKIARYAGVSESTITRLLRNTSRNPGIETVAKIIKACHRLNAERTKTKSSKNADETKTKLRKSSAAGRADK